MNIKEQNLYSLLFKLKINFIHYKRQIKFMYNTANVSCFYINNPIFKEYDIIYHQDVNKYVLCELPTNVYDLNIKKNLKYFESEYDIIEYIDKYENIS